MRRFQIRTGPALLIHLLAEGVDDHIVVECLRVQPHPEHESMHMHRLGAVGAASHTCPTLLQLLGIFHGSIHGQCRCKREACPCEGAGDFEVIGLYLNRAPHLAQPWALGTVLTAQTLSKHTKERLTICL